VASPFQRGLVRELRTPVATLGFAHLRGAWFQRPQGFCDHAFFCDPLRYTSGAFTATIGITVTALDTKLSALTGHKGPHLLLSRPLGSPRPGANDWQATYEWRSQAQFAASARDIVDDLTAVGEPWYQGFGKPGDVMERYRDEVIAPRMASGLRLPATETIYEWLQRWASEGASRAELS